MTTRLSALMAELSREDLAEVRKRSRGHLKAMAEATRLDEIRRAANLTQGDIARAMGVGQNAVSQLEKRNDLQLSTLNRYVESAGFRLEVAVISADGERFALENFRPWESVPASTKKSGVAQRTGKSASAPARSGKQSARRAAAADKPGPRAKTPKG